MRSYIAILLLYILTYHARNQSDYLLESRRKKKDDEERKKNRKFNKNAVYSAVAAVIELNGV